MLTTKCEKYSPKGSRCEQPAAEGSQLCKWHIPGERPLENDADVKESLEKMCRDGQSMSGFFIQKVNLHKIALNNADLENVDFSKTDLSYAHLYGANMQGAGAAQA